MPPANLPSGNLPPAPSPIQTLFLWRLLAEPEGGFVADLKPSLTAPARKQLQAWGLIEIEKRKRTAKARPADYASLSEQGWSWAETHLDAALPTRGTAGSFDGGNVALHDRVKLKTMLLVGATGSRCERLADGRARQSVLCVDNCRRSL